MMRFPYESQLSGEEWHTIKLAEKLRERGHEIFFTGSCRILLKELKEREFETRKSWGGTAVVSKKAILLFLLTGIPIWLNLMRLLIFYRMKHRVNVLYCLTLNEKLLLTPWARLMGMQVLWLEHHRVGRWLTLNPLVPFYYLWARLAQVVCVSKSNAQKLKWVPGVKTIVNGIDLTEFKPQVVEPEKFFKQQHLKIKADDKTLYVGVIARLYKDKGVDDFVRAVEHLVSKGDLKHVYFLIVGEGPELETLKSMAAKLNVEDQVIFLGFLARPKIIQFLGMIDMLVLPSSLHDPFGLTAAEAMAMKKSVVVTSACGMAENLINQKSGIVVTPKDYFELAQAINSLLINQQKRVKMGEEGYEIAKTKFDLERMVDEYEAVMGIDSRLHGNDKAGAR